MVKAMQQTNVSAVNPVMTVKGSTTPVQVASSEFYVDPATGLFRTRTLSGSTSGSARHLLQDEDPTARIASADFNLQSSGMMMSSNVFAQPSLFAALSAVDDLDVNGSSSSGGRHLMQSTSTTPLPLSVLPPICDWASADLFDLESCNTKTRTGTISPSNDQQTTVPHYSTCVTMQGACRDFAFADRVSIPMWGNSYGSGVYDLGAGRMCVSWFCHVSQPV